MRAKFLTWWPIFFIVPLVFSQVVIEDSIVVSPKSFPIIPNITSIDEEVKLPPAICINPVTGQRDTLFPREVTYEVVQKEAFLEKSVPLKGAGISTNYYVIFTAKYWTSACPENVIQKKYQIPVAVITAPPGSEHHAQVLWAEFDHRWDTIRYGTLGNDKVYFFVIKFLPSECEVYEVCRVPNPSNPDEWIPIYLHICERADTSVPSTTTEDLGDGVKVYTLTWPYAAITDTVIPPYRYEVLLPDTLHTRVSTPVIVQAKDRKTGENYYGIDPNLDFVIWADEAGERLGSFSQWRLGKNIAEGQKREIQTTRTNYFLLNTGMVNYVADGENPKVPTPIQIFVEDLYEVRGKGGMVIVGQHEDTSLSITIPEPKEIWPTLRVQDGNNPNGRNVKDGIEIHLRTNSGPVVNENVIISVEMVLPSGGHFHTNQPPLHLRGMVRAIGGTIIEGNGEVTATTDEMGKIWVSYRSSEIGGRFQFIVKVENHPKLEVRDTLNVRVPELFELPDAIYYKRIGQTHFHLSNHWGTASVIDHLQAIAMAWFLEHTNEHIIMYNDISLEYGGMFDVNGQWNTNSGHKSHRIGTDVDVRTVLPGLRVGIPVRIPKEATDWSATTWVGNRDFEDICRIFGGAPQRHSPNSTNEHYHIDF